MVSGSGRRPTVVYSREEEREQEGEAGLAPTSGVPLSPQDLNMIRRIAVSFSVIAALAAGAALRAQPEVTFRDEITVGLSSIVVRVVDGRGHPIPELVPGDFLVRVGGTEVPVAAVDWVPATDLAAGDLAEPDLDATLEEIAAADPPTAPGGRRVVFFLQTDHEPSRRHGHRNVLDHVKRLAWSLHPKDRAAVVIFDTHLKLWQDFTRDRTPIEEALEQSITFGGRDRAFRPSQAGAMSLARHFDFEAARAAASPERALELTARALAPLPGQKELIYLGWGLGELRGRAGVRMTHEYEPALEALRQAAVTVFVLDVTEADYHSLEVGLQQVADDTGGLYVRAFRFPQAATELLGRSISAYYVLTVDGSVLAGSGLPASRGPASRVRITLRDRKGTVLVRPYLLRSEPRGRSDPTRRRGRE